MRRFQSVHVRLRWPIETGHGWSAPGFALAAPGEGGLPRILEEGVLSPWRCEGRARGRLRVWRAIPTRRWRSLLPRRCVPAAPVVGYVQVTAAASRLQNGVTSCSMLTAGSSRGGLGAPAGPEEPHGGATYVGDAERVFRAGCGGGGRARTLANVMTASEMSTKGGPPAPAAEYPPGAGGHAHVIDGASEVAGSVLPGGALFGAGRGIGAHRGEPLGEYAGCVAAAKATDEDAYAARALGGGASLGAATAAAFLLA